MAEVDLFLSLAFSISPFSESEDRELYFQLLTFKEAAFISNSFLTCCPHFTAAR